MEIDRHAATSENLPEPQLITKLNAQVVELFNSQVTSDDRFAYTVEDAARVAVAQDETNAQELWDVIKDYTGIKPPEIDFFMDTHEDIQDWPDLYKELSAQVLATSLLKKNRKLRAENKRREEEYGYDGIF